MEKETKRIIIVMAAVVVVLIAAVAVTSAIKSSDENWEHMTTDALAEHGYPGVTLSSCTHAITDNSAMVLGAFVYQGTYHNYSIQFVKENGNWKAYDVYVS